MPYKQRRDILLELLPTEVADPFIMHFQDHPAPGILKQHALNKVDMLMEFHPASKSTNLADQCGEESDEERPEDELECLQCNEDAPDVVRQLMSVFKKFGNCNASSPAGQSPSMDRPSRCLNCGDTGRQISSCPKPEVPGDERP